MTGRSNGASVLGIAMAMALGAGASQANIVYQFNRTVGSGSVVGTLTTDGATGVLGAGDILAWNLLLSGPGATFLLTSPNNSYVSGTDLTATTLDLYFNFSGTDGGRFLLQQGPEDGHTYYCVATSSFDCIKGESVVPVFFSDSSSQFATPSGVQILGTAGIPEPASWAMMLAGFGAIGLAARRRRSAKVAAA